jgi:hypothetical protein
MAGSSQERPDDVAPEADAPGPAVEPDDEGADDGVALPQAIATIAVAIRSTIGRWARTLGQLRRS